jgi:hypothetical protein
MIKKVDAEIALIEATLFSRSEERVDQSRTCGIGVSPRRAIKLCIGAWRRLTRSSLRLTTLSTASGKEGKRICICYQVKSALCFSRSYF